MNDVKHTIDDKEPLLSVTIEGEGISIKQQISSDLLPSLLALILGQPITKISHLDATPSQVGVVASTKMPRRTGLSVVEYLNDKAPKSIPDTILVLGRYSEIHEGKEEFTKDDIRKLMRSARIPDPANFNRDFGISLSRAYIQSVDDGKTFHVTQTGITILANPGPADFSRARTGMGRIRRRVKPLETGSE